MKITKTTDRKTTFTNATASVNQFRQPLNRFTDELAKRRELWDRLTLEHRKRVLAADPVLGMARELYDELKGWFDAQV